jgi:hypothetical protein
MSTSRCGVLCDAARNRRTAGNANGRSVRPRAAEILLALSPQTSGAVPANRADSARRIFRATGLKGPIFHDSRSESASRMAGECGPDIVELAEQGGGQSLQVLRKYCRPDPRRIAAKLDW